MTSDEDDLRNNSAPDAKNIRTEDEKTEAAYAQ